MVAKSNLQPSKKALSRTQLYCILILGFSLQNDVQLISLQAAATGALSAGGCDRRLPTAERSQPTSEVRGRSQEDPMPEGRRPRGVTPRPRSGAAAESTRLRRHRNSREELPCVRGRRGGREEISSVRGQGWRRDELPQAPTPEAMAAGRSNPRPRPGA